MEYYILYNWLRGSKYYITVGSTRNFKSNHMVFRDARYVVSTRGKRYINHMESSKACSYSYGNNEDP